MDWNYSWYIDMGIAIVVVQTHDFMSFHILMMTVFSLTKLSIERVSKMHMLLNGTFLT